MDWDRFLNRMGASKLYTTSLFGDGGWHWRLGCVLLDLGWLYVASNWGCTLRRMDFRLMVPQRQDL
jgi:hypothetical protein